MYRFCRESFLPFIIASYQGYGEVGPHRSATREDGPRSSLGKKDRCCQPLRGDSSKATKAVRGRARTFLRIEQKKYCRKIPFSDAEQSSWESHFTQCRETEMPGKALLTSHCLVCACPSGSRDLGGGIVTAGILFRLLPHMALYNLQEAWSFAKLLCSQFPRGGKLDVCLLLTGNLANLSSSQNSHSWVKVSTRSTKKTKTTADRLSVWDIS